MTPAQSRDLAAVPLPEGWTVTVHATYGGADDTLILNPTDHPRARAWGVSLHDAAGREVGYAARRGRAVHGLTLTDAGAARPLSRLCKALWRLSYPE